MVIKGVDVSSYQPSDYSTKGLDFVFIKITEGTSYTNPKWVAQRKTARDAELVTGFYHFGRAGSMKKQADYFMSKVNLVKGDPLGHLRSDLPAWVGPVKGDLPPARFGDAPGGYAEARLAYEEAIERFSPDDLFILSEGIERAAAQLSVAELVALLRLSGWDAFTLLGVSDALLERAGDADPAVQEDLRQALYETYDRHYAVPGDGDLP